MTTIRLPKGESGLRLRMKYFTPKELEEVRPMLQRGFDAIGVKNLVEYVREQFALAETLNDGEIEAVFSEDVKIDRIRYARLIGNIESLVFAFIVEVGRDTLFERRKAKREERAARKRRKQRKEAMKECDENEDEIDTVLQGVEEETDGLPR